MNARLLGDFSRRARSTRPRKPAAKPVWCEWCGKMGKGHECELRMDHKEALRLFAMEKGCTWKVHLRHWVIGATTCALREAYDIIGPAGLYRVRVDRYLGDK